jgi:AcrR family transcriptional regulator
MGERALDLKDKSAGRSAATRESIRAAAMLHFSRHGYHGASARDIAKEAGVPLSGLHYHFGSKQELFASTFTHHFEVLSQERLRLLERVCSPTSASPTVEAIVTAFIEPLLDLARLPDGVAYLHMQARLLDEQELTARLFNAHVLRATLPFLEALERALPSAKRNDLYRGYRNMVWAVSFALIDPLYEMLAKEPALPASAPACARLAQQLVRYHAAGLKAIAAPVAKRSSASSR